MELKEAVALRIKAIRTRQGLVQKALAAKISMSLESIGKWENGVVFPSQDSFKLLSQGLGVPVSHFFDFGESLETTDPKRQRFFGMLIEAARSLDTNNLELAARIVTEISQHHDRKQSRM